MKNQKYDLEQRLLEYSARIIKVVESLPSTRVGNHIADQLLRCGTSPYPNHGEAQAAESTRDFVHKIGIALKELREASRWLKLVKYIKLINKPERLNVLIDETEQLIKIFVTSIKTARSKK
ncbi:MAG: four helix bundle protein [Sedimentisphaerales bacterium]